MVCVTLLSATAIIVWATTKNEGIIDASAHRAVFVALDSKRKRSRILLSIAPSLSSATSCSGSHKKPGHKPFSRWIHANARFPLPIYTYEQKQINTYPLRSMVIFNRVANLHTFQLPVYRVTFFQYSNSFLFARNSDVWILINLISRST